MRISLGWAGAGVRVQEAAPRGTPLTQKQIVGVEAVDATGPRAELFVP